ncbi:nucleotidyl transferase AbiEii/AbiGii toxin family protein [candidate division KSB1 bacterium]|nr:nucleotidyl transferase AbiEii/AbiGii toxin family protein [candidate division KSB1 bacterium]
MDIFKRHEIFEIEVLEKLQSQRLLGSLVFGGGSMLRLCHELDRYSVDLDFWRIKEIPPIELYEKFQQFLLNEYNVTDAQIKHCTVLFEIRSADFPLRLKIEIRKEIKNCDFEEKIAFSKFSTKQVLLKALTLNQSMKNKIAALLDRNEIRDGFDLEFLLRRGISLPDLSQNDVIKLINKIKGFKAKDFKVTLGSLLASDMRQYYVKNHFSFLTQKLEALGRYD